MSKKRQFRRLEKQLINKHDKRDNEVILENEDFRDGKLSWSGYKRLKDECEYVDYAEDIEIKVPDCYVDGFMGCLESMATSELSHIKKDKRDARIAALVFLLIGVAVLVLSFVGERIIRQEILYIVSWVFIWAAADKMFFDRKQLQNNRYNILHILSAQVTGY